MYVLHKFGNTARASSVDGYGKCRPIRRKDLPIQGRELPYPEKDLPPGSPNAFESLFITFLKPDIMQRH